MLVALVATAAPLEAQARIGDLVVRSGDVPRRLVGYGLVVGLDGTGDRSFGAIGAETPTVRSVVNLLKRFNVVVPPEAMQLRNVAAVLVTAEASPYLRAGGRFEVQVASLGDATSLRGGVLWMTPLVTDVSQPPIATAQGPLLLSTDETVRAASRRGGSARIPDGGLLEVDPPAPTAPATAPRLQLRRPDLGTAVRIAEAVNAAFGAGTAKVEDPGAVALMPQGQAADNLPGLLAAIDTLSVAAGGPARIVINAKDGTVVAGGDARIGPAAVTHHGITLRIGGQPAAGGGRPPVAGQAEVALAAGTSVQDVAAGLHAVGASSQEVAAIFDALVQVGAIGAQVVVR